MRAMRLWALVPLLVLATACTTDTTEPSPRQTQGPQFTHLLPDQTLDETYHNIVDALQCLYVGPGTGGVIPNPQSAISKLNELIAAIQAGDLAAIVTAYDNTITFIVSWQNSAKTDLGKSLTCGSNAGDLTGQTYTVAQLFAIVFENMDVLDESGGLDGNLCFLDNPGGECTDEDTEDRSAVFFPTGAFPELTGVYIENSPPGFTRLQDKLAEYPTYVRILTSGVNEFPAGGPQPLVVVCFRDGVSALEATLLNRLRLGSLHTETDPLTGLPVSEFKLLAPPAGTDYTTAYAFCNPTAPSETSVLGFSNDNVFGRLVNRVADVLMPAALHAMYANYSSFGGAGGSAEEFSEFGAVDPGMGYSFGGAGGSAEEFSPAAIPSTAPSRPATVDVVDENEDGVADRYVGSIDETWSGFPAVKVASPENQLTGADPVGIAGVTVKWVIAPPKAGGDYEGQDSDAYFCGTDGDTVTTTETGPNGTATAPCINFGPNPGYKNLKVSFEPGDVDPLACILDNDGNCAPTDTDGFSKYPGGTVHFLLETREPPDEFSCSMGSKVNKVTFASYSSTTGQWTGWFRAADFTRRIRQVTVQMSLTGRSSTESAFGVRLYAYRSTDTTDPISEGSTDKPGGVLALPGDNGSPRAVRFLMTPDEAVGAEPVWFKMVVTAPSTRAPQLWYRTDSYTSVTDCVAARAYSSGAFPGTATTKQTVSGLLLDINNTVWP